MESYIFIRKKCFLKIEAKCKIKYAWKVALLSRASTSPLNPPLVLPLETRHSPKLHTPRTRIRAALWHCLLVLLAATQRCLFQSFQTKNTTDKRTIFCSVGRKCSHELWTRFSFSKSFSQFQAHPSSWPLSPKPCQSKASGESASSCSCLLFRHRFSARMNDNWMVKGLRVFQAKHTLKVRACVRPFQRRLGSARLGAKGAKCANVQVSHLYTNKRNLVPCLDKI